MSANKVTAPSVSVQVLHMLRTAYLLGFNASGEGYNGEYPFNDSDILPEADTDWVHRRELQLIKLLIDSALQQPTTLTKELL